MTMPLRLGDDAPNFTANSTQGEIDFHAWKGDSWAILFSHPADFTPVCTAEACAFRDNYDGVAELGVQVIGVKSAG